MRLKAARLPTKQPAEGRAGHPRHWAACAPVHTLNVPSRPQLSPPATNLPGLCGLWCPEGQRQPHALPANGRPLPGVRCPVPGLALHRLRPAGRPLAHEPTACNTSTNARRTRTCNTHAKPCAALHPLGTRTCCRVFMQTLRSPTTERPPTRIGTNSLIKVASVTLMCQALTGATVATGTVRVRQPTSPAPWPNPCPCAQSMLAGTSREAGLCSLLYT
jgi:hypothetical protein